MNFQYHPDAAKELLSCVNYYEEKSAGLGAEFLDEIEFTIAHVSVQPQSGSSLNSTERRILLNRFPYELVYSLSEDMVTILAVKHMKQRPGYWEYRK